MEFTENFLKLFVPNGYDEYYQFSRQTVVDKNIIKKLKIPYFDNIFKKIYIPCKYKNYVLNLNPKKCITLLRQLVKLYGYTLNSCEKYSRGIKHIIYQVIPITERKYIYQQYYNPQPKTSKIEFKEEKVVISWD